MITEQELFLKNQKLSTEFDLYLAEHPEIEDQIPDNALIVLLSEYDKVLSKKIWDWRNAIVNQASR